MKVVTSFSNLIDKLESVIREAVENGENVDTIEVTQTELDGMKEEIATMLIDVDQFLSLSGAEAQDLPQDFVGAAMVYKGIPVKIVQQSKLH